LFRDLWEIIKYGIKQVVTSRITPMVILFAVMFGALVFRLFQLQIVEGAGYQEEYLESTKREIYTTATRGNIYDCNGIPLAYNELTYSVTVLDNGTYPTGYAKNKMLLRLIRLLDDYDVTLVGDTPLAVLEDDTIVFTTTSESKHRAFLRDFYGLRSTSLLDTHNDDNELINRSDITAQEVYEKYIDKYGIGDDSSRSPNTYEYTLEEGLKLINMRIAMAASSYRKYEAVTLATGLDTSAMMAVKEAAADLSGVDIAEETIRVYNDAYEFAHILGYTGKASTDDLKTLQTDAEEAGIADAKKYAAGDVVGKAGIEEYMELDLSGTKGTAEIYVDNEGRIIETTSSTAPLAGNDVYLSIDRDLQVGIYHLAEQMVAGILVEKIENVEPDHSRVTKNKVIPIKRVYYQLIGNNILSMSQFDEWDASEVEKNIFSKMEEERSIVMEEIRYELTRDNPIAYNDLDENNQSYTSYILTLLKNGGYIISDKIDTDDETYKAWVAGTISLKEYLNYAISMNWVDTTRLQIEEKYPTANTIYQVMLDTVMEILKTNSDFCKKIYEILVYDGTITGRELCLALFEQGVLEWNEENVEKLVNGGNNAAYNFIKKTISNLEITPGELALTPSACSVVISDVKTGQAKALVSYPSYDINRLSGTIDAAYYSQLQNDAATPLYNTATQALRAPGSVFKMVSAAAALEEGVYGLTEEIFDTGTYVQFNGQYKLNCWNLRGHGPMNVVSALSWSCNYYFGDVGYRLSLEDDGTYSSALGLSKLAKYASMFGFDSKSGIEIYENQPSISDENPIPSAIGQGTHAFANIHLARYATALATKGNMYRFTLLDHVTDSTGNVLKEHEPEIQYTIDLKESTWNALWDGMYHVVTDGSAYEPFEDCVTSLAGKTGTAQEATTKPNHARFVCFAPYEDPEIALTITIPNGYTGTNAALLANEVLNFYYGAITLEEIVSNGEAIDADGGSARD